MQTRRAFITFQTFKTKKPTATAGVQAFIVPFLGPPPPSAVFMSAGDKTREVKVRSPTRGRVEHGRQTDPHGTQGPAASRVLLILGGVRGMFVAGGLEVHDKNGGAHTIIVPPGRWIVHRRHVGGTAGIVLLRGCLELCLRGGGFLASSALSADGLIDRTMLRDEVGVRRGHGRYGILTHALAVNLALYQLLLLQEEQVVPMFLLRLLERQHRRRSRLHRHGGVIVSTAPAPW